MLTSLKQLLTLLGRRQRRHGALLLGMIVLGALVEVVGVAAVPAFISAVIDPSALRRFGVFGGVVDWLEATDATTAMIYGSVALIGIFAAKTAFLMLNFHLQVRYVSNRRMDMSKRLIRAYMRAPYRFHLGRNTAELLRNVDRESGVIAYSVLGALLEVTTRFVIMIAVLAFLFVAEPWVTVYWIVLFGALGIAGTKMIGARLKREGLREQTERKKFIQALHQAFGTVKEARVLNREGYFEDRIGESLTEITAATQFKLFSGKVIAPVTELIAITGLLTLTAGLMYIGRPTETIVITLSLFVIGLVRLRETLNASLYHLSNLRYSLVSITPVFNDLMELERGEEAMVPAPPAPVEAPRRGKVLRDSIRFEDVWHSYDSGGAPSLSGIDFEVPAGATIGIVGGTGAGKSTLIDLMLGLLAPDKGRILVDGQDIHDPEPSAWQKVIGYVPQSIYLLDDTVRRNIALGVTDAEMDETALWRAVQRAQLEPFLKRQPQGLDTVIGERGVRISGGERQRIGIARALYHDPEVLILDEATSALDNETERAVVEAVQASKGERTIVMIAHRLSTVRNCSTLHFVKAGRIVASGTFEELQERSDEFRLMAQVDPRSDASG